MKNFNNPIENRTRSFPACSAVSKPSAHSGLFVFIYSFNSLNRKRNTRDALNIVSFGLQHNNRYVSNHITELQTHVPYAEERKVL